MASGGKRRVLSHIVGPGRLGSALAVNLHRAGWPVESLVVHTRKRIRVRVSKLARQVGARVVEAGQLSLGPGVVWITVPDGSIASVAADLAARQAWLGCIVFHTSGALTSDVLQPLRAKGAKVASVHPLMTFAAGTVPDLKGVTFGVEGDSAAVRMAKRIVRDLGGVPIEIRKADKVMYHAFGAFASPMLIALMAALEEVGAAAGFERKKLRSVAGRLLRQTLENYLEHGAAVAFTGPFVRGDVAVIERHLKALRETPLVREVYLALSRLAVEKLPVKNRGAVKKIIGVRKSSAGAMRKSRKRLRLGE